MSKPPIKFIKEMAQTIYITRSIADTLGKTFQVEITGDSAIGTHMPQLLLYNEDGPAGTAHVPWLNPHDPYRTYLNTIGAMMKWRKLLRNKMPVYGVVFIKAMYNEDGYVPVSSDEDGVGEILIASFDVEDGDYYFFMVGDEKGGPQEVSVSDGNSFFMKEFMRGIYETFKEREGHDW